MKAKLIFDVPEERKAFMAAAKANDMALALWDITYNVGKSMERHYESKPDEEYDKLRPMDAIVEFRERISDTLNEYGINIDDLTE
jgi:DNA polymerase III delta prime subunit